MADLDLLNFQGFLDYEGLEYYDGKSKASMDAKVSTETTRAKKAESDLDTKKIDKTTVATSSTLGLVKSGTDITVDSSGNVSVNDDSHNHVISNVDGLQSTLDAKAPIASPTLTGTPKAPTASAGTNTTQIATTAFVQTAIGNLINSAPESANTLKELSDLIEEHQDVTDALNEAIGKKAASSDLTSHTGNTTVHITSTERTNWNDANSKKHSHSNKTVLDNTTASYTTAEQTKLSGIATGAEVNQNAFSNVTVGSTTISADSKTDTLTLVAGSNVTITPDATNDKVTIAATNTVYTHPTTSGNKHIPSGGSSGQILRWSADGTAAWGADNNTTYSAATQSASGLMSAADKKKLDGIASGANNYTYTLPSAGSSLGGVKSGGDVTISSGVITVNDDSHNHVISNVDNLQTTLDSKAVIKTLTSENLNDVVKEGFYNAGGGNSVTNKPSGVDHFGLYVIHRASGAYYTQILLGGDTKSYRRHCENGTWGSWSEDKLTDNNTTYSTFVKSGSGAKAGLVPAPSTTAGTTKYLREDGTWATPPDTNTTYSKLSQFTNDSGYITGITKAMVTTALGYTPPTMNTTYSQATSSALGLVKIGYTASGKNYPVQLNSSGQMYVNVPWTDTNTNTTYSQATSSALGLVKIGYSASGKNYAVQLDSNGKMYVNVPWTDNNTTYSNMTGATSSADGKAGLVPAPASGKQTSFLRGDGTWVVPTNTTYSNMTAATSSAAGKAGLVPAPTAGAQAKFLRGDGTWQTPTNTTYSAATTSSAGLMSAADKTKLDSIATGANKYSLPTASSSTLGGVKTTSTVTSTSGLTACPIISGVPYYKDTNTTYSAATTSANGLMTSAMVTKLNGIATGATKNSVTTSLASTSTTNALAASAGKSLQDQITALNSDLGRIPDGTYEIDGILSKSNWGQYVLIYQLPLNVDTSLYYIECKSLSVGIDSNVVNVPIFACKFQTHSIYVSTTETGYDGRMAYATVNILKVR